MNRFEKNIINIYDQRGKFWLKALPIIIKKFAKQYDLTKLIPIKNLSFNYVLTGRKDKLFIVLKLGLDFAALEREASALKVFAEYGAVKVIAKEQGMLLLEQVVPGTSLKANSLLNDKEKLTVACQVIKKLHQAPVPKNNDFPDIKDWFKTLDQDWAMPSHYLQKARKLKDKLLLTTVEPVLLHGDLHFDNILQNKENWKVIDPKGVIGYPINEVWACVTDIAKDTQFIADYFNFDLQTVRDWYFIHVNMAVCWNFEDNSDPESFMKLADQAYSLISI